MPNIWNPFNIPVMWLIWQCGLHSVLLFLTGHNVSLYRNSCMCEKGLSDKFIDGVEWSEFDVYLVLLLSKCFSQFCVWHPLKDFLNASFAVLSSSARRISYIEPLHPYNTIFSLRNKKWVWWDIVWVSGIMNYHCLVFW